MFDTAVHTLIFTIKNNSVAESTTLDSTAITLTH